VNNKIKCLEYQPPINASILRVRFYSYTSVHSTTRFVLHYSTVLVDPSAPCPGLPPSEAWHHVSAVVNVSDPLSARLSLYINGSLVASSQGLLYSPSGLAVTGDMGLAIGRADTARAPPLIGGVLSNYIDTTFIRRGADTFWFGGLDEIRIWNRSLAGPDVSASFNSSCASQGMVGVGPAEGPSSPLVCFGFEDLWVGGDAAGFRDSGTEDGAQLVPVVGDRNTAWCETRGDEGQLMSQFGRASRAQNENGQSWGFCTNKPQVPGLGFNYSESALLHFQMRDVKTLPELPGCGEVPIIFSSNRAEK
jgi:hypothetical protein